MAEIIGIDAGCGSTVIYSHERGIILKEPSVMAFHRETGQQVAAGREVWDLDNRAGLYKVLYPVREQKYVRELMRYFLEKACYGREVLRPQVVFTVRCDMAHSTVMEMKKGFWDADAREAFMYPRLLAEGYGSGVKISSLETSFVLRMGQSVTEMALIAENRILRPAFLYLGGRDVDRELKRWFKLRAGLIVSEKEAEHIRIHMPSLIVSTPMQKLCVRGRDVFSGAITEKSVSVMEIKKCLLKAYSPIIDGITEFLEGTPEPARSDAFERGMLFTGGVSGQAGLPEYIERETGLMVLQAPGKIEKCASAAVELYKRRR